MKRYLIIFILFISAGMMPAKADYIATHNFYVDADTTVSVDVSGSLSSTISGETGQLSTPFNINFHIGTNEALPDIHIRSYVENATFSKCCACSSSCATVENAISFDLILANNLHKPEQSAIYNAESAGGPPTSLSNANTIAYPSTITINNGGLLQYHWIDRNSYFSATVGTGETDIDIAVSATPKAGTYDVATAQDEPDNYVVEIYLDNLPG